MTGTDWLDQLEQKAAAATAGPWFTDGLEGTVDADNGTRVVEGIGMWGEADAEFIAAANPHTVQRLINEVRRQEAAWAEQLRITTALAAKVARIEALAADYETGTYWAFGRTLRAALSDGSDQ